MLNKDKKNIIHELMKSYMLHDVSEVLLKSSIIVNKELRFRMCLICY